MKKYLVFSSIGFELAALIWGSVYVGDLLDKNYQSKGMITIGLIVISLTGWLIRLVWLLKKIQSETENEKD